MPGASTTNLRGVCRTNVKEKFNETIQFGPTPTSYFIDLASPDSNNGPSFSFARTERNMHSHLKNQRREALFEEEDVRIKKPNGQPIPQEVRFSHDFATNARAKLPGPGHYEFVNEKCERMCTIGGENPPLFTIPKGGGLKSDVNELKCESRKKQELEPANESPVQDRRPSLDSSKDNR